FRARQALRGADHVAAATRHGAQRIHVQRNDLAVRGGLHHVGLRALGGGVERLLARGGLRARRRARLVLDDEARLGGERGVVERAKVDGGRERRRAGAGALFAAAERAADAEGRAVADLLGVTDGERALAVLPARADTDAAVLAAAV